MTQNDLKLQAAKAAIDLIEMDAIVGVGTGSTVNFFIDELVKIKHKIEGVVSSSLASTERMRKLGIPVVDLNSVGELSVYVDGADEIEPHGYMIKGGGAALTGEKIVAQLAQKFICIVDSSKKVDVLGQFPLPIEVIPSARGLVARALVKLGGNPEYRLGVKTDYGNIMLDVAGLNLTNPVEMEKILNNIPGVVTNGLFAIRKADIALIASEQGVERIEF
jgi:ribose 5-phosphate isomerase A